jgi:hypothetical protein
MSPHEVKGGFDLLAEVALFQEIGWLGKGKAGHNRKDKS